MRSYEEIAKKLGVSKTMVSYLLRGLRGMSWSIAKRASKRFGNSPAWWMEARPSELQRMMRGDK